MALNISPVHRNLHTRVSFLYLEFEDWFVVIGLAALTNIFGRWVDRQLFGIPMNVFLQYIVPVLSIPFLMLFKYGKPGGYSRSWQKSGPTHHRFAAALQKNGRAADRVTCQAGRSRATACVPCVSRGPAARG